jgi:hypothetical protein
VHLRRTGSVDIYTGAGAEQTHAAVSSPSHFEASFRSASAAAATTTAAADAAVASSPRRPTVRLTSELLPHHTQQQQLLQQTATPSGASATQAAAAAATTTSASVTASSKAVLGALRALQEKIRRLEGERAHAATEAERLRAELAEAGLASEMQRREEAMGHEEELQELRLAYGRLMEERVVLEGKLADSGECVGRENGPKPRQACIHSRPASQPVSQRPDR